MGFYNNRTAVGLAPAEDEYTGDGCAHNHGCGHTDEHENQANIVLTRSEWPDGSVLIDKDKEHVSRFWIFGHKRSKFSLPVYKYLEGINKGNLFFCFLDKTNNESTYPGGRYIDIEFENAKRIELDFNKSYNPYCVYDEEFSCPIPPKKNYINMEIRAGEKLSI